MSLDVVAIGYLSNVWEKSNLQILDQIDLTILSNLKMRSRLINPPILKDNS